MNRGLGCDDDNTVSVSCLIAHVWQRFHNEAQKGA